MEIKTHLPHEKYCSGEYARDNPDWDITDSPWKANKITEILSFNKLEFNSVVEVGCGAGAVLSELEQRFPDAQFKGYDIAADASAFWDKYSSPRVSFEVGNFFELNKQHYDLLLLLDVVEHVPDPLSFLVSLHNHAEYFVFHIPLDLNAISVVRESPLLYVRNKVGHIHYFTKNLALSMLKECGYSIIDWKYTGASNSSPQRTFKTWLANVPRFMMSKINKDLSVRILGGETLLVLAKRGGN